MGSLGGREGWGRMMELLRGYEVFGKWVGLGWLDLTCCCVWEGRRS
jgi:hypothetical protein